MSVGALTRALYPFLGPLVIALLELPLLFPAPAVGDNFQFWVAGHMVTSGMSPYDRASWVAAAAYGPVPGGVAASTVATNLAITQQVWLYPPQTAFLFAPFGALPLEVGVPLLHLFIGITAFAGIAVAAWALGLRGPALAFVLSLTVVSQPFVIAVRNGHPIGLLLLGATLLLRGLSARDARAVAFGAALLTLKPQLVFPVAVGAAAYALVRRDVRSLATMAAAALLVTVPFEIVTPFPFGALLSSSNERLDVDLSTVFALARDLGGGTALALVLVAAGITLCALAARWTRPSERPLVVAASLGVLALLSPYVHDYDLLIGVPAVMAAVVLGAGRAAERAITLLAAAALVLVPWLLFYWWPLAGEPSRRYLGGPLGAVPLVFALALTAAAILASRPALAYARDRTPHQDEREMA